MQSRESQNSRESAASSAEKKTSGISFPAPVIRKEMETDMQPLSGNSGTIPIAFAASVQRKKSETTSGTGVISPVQKKTGIIGPRPVAPVSGPVAQLLRGRLLQEPNDDEVYLNDIDSAESYGLSAEERAKANVGDTVGYRVLPGFMAEITDWTGMDTVSTIIRQIAQTLRIDDPVRLSLLLDFSRDEIRTSGSIRGRLRGYLRDWGSFTSCYNTADSLFGLLRTGGVVNNPGNSVATTRDALIAAVRAAASHGAIFRVRCGIHGFIIMVRGGANVELLQSFAGAEGEMLATNLAANKSWGLEAMVTLLTNMVSNSEDERNAAQETLFGGSITADAWPPAEYTWSQSSIKTPDDIEQDVMTKLTQNNQELRDQLR